MEPAERRYCIDQKKQKTDRTLVNSMGRKLPLTKLIGFCHATAIRVKNALHPLAGIGLKPDCSGGSLDPVEPNARPYFAAQQAEKHDHTVF